MKEGPVRSHVMSTEELLKWGLEFKAGVERCKDPNAPLIAGKHCKWCPAATICPEISDRAFERANVSFKPQIQKEIKTPALPDPERLLTVKL